MSDQYGFQEPRQSSAPEERGESLGALIGRYWALFRRFYWVLILTSIACVAAAYFWTDRQPRIYQATSKLIFHESRPNVFGKQFERVELVDPGGRWQFEQFWNTQKEVLGSKWFAQRVIEREGLLDAPGFLSPSVQQLDEDERMKRAVNTLQRVAVYSLQRDSRVGLVQVRFKDPELAASIADGISETYVEYIREFQTGGLRQLANWFDDYVSTKREELDESRSELQKYQRDNNILSHTFEDRREMAAEGLAAVSTQLRDVQARLFAEEALLNQLETMESRGDDLRALGDLVDNPALKRGLDRESELLERRAELKTRYLDAHPEVRAVDEQLEVVRRSIEEEIGRIRTAVANRAAVTRRNTANLQEEIERHKAEIAELNQIGFRYTEMRDSTETLRQHYETVLGRTNELDLNALYESEIIQILENADVPGAPISPQVPLNLAVGLLLGLFLGGSIMVLIDALDTTVKTEEHVTKYTTRPILGMLPAVNAGAVKGVEKFGDSALDTLTHTAPRSSFAEAIKTLRTNLMFMAPDNPPRVLLMTSPGPGEGKTLTSVNMAIALAQSGQRTLVIDSDMRRPRVHKALGMDNTVGLSEAITGERTYKEAVRPTGIENLEVMTCGPVPPNPSELLQTERFRKLVRDLREDYDRVIFDSPPLAAVADALVLSHSADVVLLILKFGQTRQELLRRSIEQLESIGAPFGGTVLNDIDENAGYGYAYYYRYRYDEPGDSGDSKGGKMAS
ncbi:hypothetical protein DV096_17425 [Bradymonadaceae bacterium TMQ3]|uniref:Polysaccharide biosynthesis tyrosine autokinase n=1 Tax=Lujinxingia sediminis TaxID=2480984 RepID=A0ABY0CPW1_9DELT|nr:polysaccharide biosynthesis tyrosine autokinase [Lujinxingia sediminis]RDV36863.1 hypothetical protein DV096_17425 [Bradymonadaceae bacterium TMQ3]RVU42156.1 polysaccharide biosynthesis tyrosine autokinase [Lujinxingia sediminis]TXC69486.1 polysaccharide biosynthesis tyrosine autokinase [Bradymonadales bacterium TMQ1]